MAMLRKDFHQENYKHLTNDQLQLSAREKRANWWYYHKWHVVIGGVLLFCAIDIGKDMLHIGETEADYQIAYVGTHALPDDTIEQLTELFESIGEDCNGDGKITVEIHQYASQDTGEDGTETGSGSNDNTLSAGVTTGTATSAFNSGVTSTSSNSDSAYYQYAAEVTLLGDLESNDSFFFLLEDPEGFEQDNVALAYTDGSLPADTARDY